MKKMFSIKKMVSLMLIAAIALISAACGNTSKTSSGPVELLWYVPCNAQSDQAAVMEKVNEITESEIGIKVNFQFIDSTAYKEKMNMVVASNEDYDLCFTASWSLNYQQCAAKGAFLDLGELLDKYGTGIKEIVPENVINSVKVNGKLYAIPNYQTMAGTIVAFTYKKYCDKYGFDMSTVKKAEDIEPFMEVIKKNEPNVIPLRLDYGPQITISRDYENLLDNVIFISKNDDSYKVTNAYEAREYMGKLYLDWYKKGYIRQDINTKGDDTAERYAGKYAFSFTAGKPGIGANLNKEYGEEMVYADITEPYVNHDAALSSLTAVSRTTKHPEEAMKLLNLVNTNKELYNLLCNGIEGKHYTKLEDGRIKAIEDSGYAPNRDWVFGCQFNAYVFDGNDPDVWEKTKEWNETSKSSKLLGFSFDREKVKTQITAVSNAMKEYDALFNGSIDPNKWDALYAEYKEKLKNSGLEEITAEYQRQVDEWLKTNK